MVIELITITRYQCCDHCQNSCSPSCVDEHKTPCRGADKGSVPITTVVEVS